MSVRELDETNAGDKPRFEPPRSMFESSIAIQEGCDVQEFNETVPAELLELFK